jgi:hypothetical protein
MQYFFPKITELFEKTVVFRAFLNIPHAPYCIIYHRFFHFMRVENEKRSVFEVTRRFFSCFFASIGGVLSASEAFSDNIAR